MHQIRFRVGLWPGPPRGAHNSPRSPSRMGRGHHPPRPHGISISVPLAPRLEPPCNTLCAIHAVWIKKGTLYISSVTQSRIAINLNKIASKCCWKDANSQWLDKIWLLDNSFLVVHIHGGPKKWHFLVFEFFHVRCIIFAISVYSRITFIKLCSALSADVNKFCFYANN